MVVCCLYFGSEISFVSHLLTAREREILKAVAISKNLYDYKITAVSACPSACDNKFSPILLYEKGFLIILVQETLNMGRSTGQKLCL